MSLIAIAVAPLEGTRSFAIINTFHIRSALKLLLG
jgi:hypothetical protein